MLAKIRVAFVSHHHPWRGVGGGRLRERELLERLRERFAITVVAVCKAAADLASDAPGGVPVLAVPAARSPVRDFLRSPAERHHRSPAAAGELAALLTRGAFDLVHVEGHYLCRLLPEPLPAPLVVADNNVESDLLAQRVALAGWPAHRAALRWERERTRRSEARAWAQAAAIVTVTDRDCELVHELAPLADVHVVPDGADHLPLPGAAATRASARVLFAANWAYSPNVDAARWLLDAVGPRIVAAEPRATIHLAGADAPAWLRRKVDALPWAELTSPFAAVEPLLEDAQVVLCPLRIGGGVKVKVLEAVRRGRPVVTTAVGAQGIDGPAREALLVGDDAGALARHVTALLCDSAHHAEVEWATLAAAGALPSWDACAGALAACWEGVLGVRAGPAPPLGAAAT